MKSKKVASRKLWMSVSSILAVVVLPILYRQLEIGNEITLFVLGAVSALTSTYNVSNAMAKKYEGE